MSAARSESLTANSAMTHNTSVSLTAVPTPGDELVLMWVEREHRLAVGLRDTGIAVSEAVGERPVERLDAIVQRHPRIDLAAVREQFPPAVDSLEVRGDNNSSGPGSGSATAATRT
jgi:hypothetical protein